MPKTDVEEFLELCEATFRMLFVKRWREGDDPPFRTMEELIELREDLHQHVGSMLMLIVFIFQLAEKRDDINTLSLNRMLVDLATIGHDGEEVLIGDARSKDDAYYHTEARARKIFTRYLQKLSFSDLATIVEEYPTKSKPEYRFVKVVDELQAWMYMLFLDCCNWTSRDFSDPESILSYRMSEEFPLLREIADELLVRIQERLGKTAP